MATPNSFHRWICRQANKSSHHAFSLLTSCK